MKKELFICLGVIVFVIVLNIVSQKYLENCIDIITKNLEEIKEGVNKAREIEEYDNKELLKMLENTKDIWNQMQEKLAYYIEHEELEKVETQLFLLSGEIETKIYEDAVPEIEKCIFILEHIIQKSQINIKNVF